VNVIQDRKWEIFFNVVVGCLDFLGTFLDVIVHLPGGFTVVTRILLEHRLIKLVKLEILKLFLDEAFLTLDLLLHLHHVFEVFCVGLNLLLRYMERVQDL
jgi:hypothetical protein